jgi:mannose-6-phosphate isomerase-like protein (cupin superfamily)
MTDSAAAAPAPVVARRDEAEARWWVGCLARIHLTAADTGGHLSVLEITEPPNAEGPLHVHHREDETFVILEGEAEFEVGDLRFRAGPGDVVFGPRGVPHRFATGPEGCRLLFVMTPGGFEDLVRGMSVPAAAPTVPPADLQIDWEAAARVAEANGCEILS